MMGKTLLTYLVKHFLGTFLLVAFTFVTLVILADIVDHLDGFLAYNLPLSDYFLYYLYTMPNILVVCLPLSVMLSGIYLFRMLSTSNAYIALITGGVPLIRMVWPLLLITIMICFSSYLLNDRIAPEARFRRKVFQKEKFKMRREVLRNVNVISDDGRKIHIHEYRKREKVITGLMVTETGDEGQVVIRLFMDKASWNGKEWHGEGVVRQTYGSDGLPLEKEIWKERSFPSVIKPGDILLLSAKNDPKYLTASQLKEIIRAMPIQQAKVRQGLLLDYYRKYSVSVLPLVILVVGIPFGISPVKAASSKPIGFGVLISMGYYIVDALFYQAGRGLLIPPLVAAWAPGILFGLLGVWLLRRAPH